MIGGGGGDLGCRGHFWGTYRSIKRRPVCAGLPGMYRSPGPSQCSGDWTRQASSWGPVPQPPQARSSCSPVVGAWLALPSSLHCQYLPPRRSQQLVIDWCGNMKVQPPCKEAGQTGGTIFTPGLPIGLLRSEPLFGFFLFLVLANFSPENASQ